MFLYSILYYCTMSFHSMLYKKNCLKFPKFLFESCTVVEISIQKKNKWFAFNNLGIFIKKIYTTLRTMCYSSKPVIQNYTIRILFNKQIHILRCTVTKKCSWLQTYVLPTQFLSIKIRSWSQFFWETVHSAFSKYVF